MLLLEFNLHTSYSKLLLTLVNFCLATMQSWVIEQGNDSGFRLLALPTQHLEILILKIKR